MMEKKRDAKCCYIFSFTIAFYKLRLVHLGNENLFKVECEVKYSHSLNNILSF